MANITAGVVIDVGTIVGVVAVDLVGDIGAVDDDGEGVDKVEISRDRNVEEEDQSFPHCPHLWLYSNFRKLSLSARRYP